jgi:hypothetical protein
MPPGEHLAWRQYFVIISDTEFETHPVIRTDLRLSVTPGMVDLKGSAVSYVETNVGPGKQGVLGSMMDELRLITTMTRCQS